MGTTESKMDEWISSRSEIKLLSPEELLYRTWFGLVYHRETFHASVPVHNFELPASLNEAGYSSNSLLNYEIRLSEIL